VVDGQGPAGDAGAVVEVPIAEAAERLGLSTEAVRKRVQRGTLAGHKRDGAWFVAVGALDAAAAGRQDGPDAPRQDVQTGTAGRLDGAGGDRLDGRTRLPNGDQPAGSSVDLAPLADLITTQQAEIQRLTEAATTWQLRARHLEERLLALGSGEPGPPPSSPATTSPASPPAPDPAPRPWWRRLLGGR
jgi:hypothetical protein